jgi:acyl-ACP thioesterase
VVRRSAFTEMVAVPASGRVYSQIRRALLSDCAPSGRLRLDALAGWLQDVAYLDVDDAGLAPLAVWVVRRTRMCVNRFPRFGEHLTVRTFCSGLGKMWAERRTIVSSDVSGEGDVEAVSLWVHLDPVSRRPIPLTDEEITTYGGAAASRRITARLRHRAAESLQGRRWTFRAVDCDIAAHVNNAVYWQPLEEELLSGPEPGRIDVEIEFRSPAQPGEMTLVSEGDTRWIIGADGMTHASIVVAEMEAD